MKRSSIDRGGQEAESSNGAASPSQAPKTELVFIATTEKTLARDLQEGQRRAAAIRYKMHSEMAFDTMPFGLARLGPELLSPLYPYKFRWQVPSTNIIACR